MNPNHYNTNQRRKKPLIVLGVVIIFLAIIVTTFMGGGSRPKTDERLVAYRNDDFSILYPKAYSDIVDGGDYIAFNEAGESASNGKVSVSRSQNYSKTLIDTMQGVLDQEARDNKDVFVGRKKISNTEVLTKIQTIDDRVTTNVFYFTNDAVWKLTLEHNSGQYLADLTDQIIQSFSVEKAAGNE